MEAVVLHAVDDKPPPPPLRLAWQCERWNTLPEAGGLYVQDARTLFEMNATLSIYNAIFRIKTLKGKNIHQLTDNERKILRMLMDNKLLFV